MTSKSLQHATQHVSQPQEFDAVLGGHTGYYLSSAVLGGIEGVRQRLACNSVNQRLKALKDALNYGRVGSDAIAKALQDKAWQVRSRAYTLLQRMEPSSKQCLAGFDIKKLNFVDDLGNGVALEMVFIPGGRFRMGSPSNEEWHQEPESPQHWVRVPAFYMSKYPITQAQWQAVMGVNPAYFKGENRPVECVSWHSAVEFCQRRSQSAGWKYRLPSEAEWEYACRSGTDTAYFFGDRNDKIGEYAWYRDNSDGRTQPVGIKLPNAWGLYDMVGNVFEFCQDVWHKDYEGAPTDGSVWEGSYLFPVVRGSCWGCPPAECRSAYRIVHSPNFRNFKFGVRVSCSLV
jgi:formylglycine-generating enzyme required for sulfatase activity